MSSDDDDLDLVHLSKLTKGRISYNDETQSFNSYRKNSEVAYDRIRKEKG